MSELAPSGIRCPSEPARLTPAPSTPSTREQATDCRTGSSSSTSGSGLCTSRSAAWNRAAMLIPALSAAGRWPAWLPDHGSVSAAGDGADGGPRVLPCGDRALLLEVADGAAVAAVRTALERSPLPGQLELVPAARTVLVRLDRAPADPDRALLHRLRTQPDGGPAAAAGTVQLDVVFDGPDLAEVAERAGRPVAAVVEELTGTELE